MKRAYPLLFMLFSVCGIAGVQDSEPTRQNSVPKSLDIHFVSAAEGQEFHFYRAEAFVMKNHDCRLEIVTRYEIDHSFDAYAREVAIEVSSDGWIALRRAVRSMRVKEKREPPSAGSSEKAATWTVSITYPDTEVSFSDPDSAAFEPLRSVLSLLTKKQWPKKEANQPRLSSDAGRQHRDPSPNPRHEN